MSISYGSHRTFSCRKMGKTRSVREEVDGRVFFIIITKNCDFWVLEFSLKITFFDCLYCWNFIRSDWEETLINTRKDKFSLHQWQDFPSRGMATLRNKRKLAAVSRETPEGSRSSRGQTVLDPELTQDYISQVSEEIEGRVTKKLSKEFSKTESRILGALSKLDEFLLNPQVRTCSVAVQGTSRNANSENREIHGDRSLDDPYPDMGYFPHHSGQLNSPETETISHMVTDNYPHSQRISFASFPRRPYKIGVSIGLGNPTSENWPEMKTTSVKKSPASWVTLGKRIENDKKHKVMALFWSRTCSKNCFLDFPRKLRKRIDFEFFSVYTCLLHPSTHKRTHSGI